MALSIRYKLFRNFGITALLAVCSFSLGGCAKGVTEAVMWQYAPDSYQSGKQPLVDKRVSIPPFTDGRPEKKENFAALHLIPLMPFGWFEYSRVEDIGDLKIPVFFILPPTGTFGEFPLAKRTGQFSPTIDFAKAAANELSARGLFLEARFTESPTANEGDLLLQGHITSTRYWGKITSYGITVLGSWLWIAGFPQGAVHNELAIEFHLKEEGTGAVLWEKSYSQTYDKVPLWMYAPWDIYYAELFKAIMQDVVKELQSTFLQHQVTGR